MSSIETRRSSERNGIDGKNMKALMGEKNPARQTMATINILCRLENIVYASFGFSVDVFSAPSSMPLSVGKGKIFELLAIL
jgi:hypothetical protein